MNISVGDVNIELNSPADLALRSQLIENAKTILTTLRGTVPLNRAMGLIAKETIGQSIPVSQGAYSVQAVEQIETYEPRLKVTGISFCMEDQKIIPKVVLTYNGR